MRDPFQTLQHLKNDKKKFYYSLPKLEKDGVGHISRLPISIRIVLESLLRNCDGHKIKEKDVAQLANWSHIQPSDAEIAFVVSRVILQDFTGVPLVVDLAAMRDAVADMKRDAGLIEPDVPVDLVVDHSVQVDRSGTSDAYLSNLKLEFERNQERYEFLKWGQQAYKTFKVVPPGIGIVHQVNLEYISTLVMEKTYNGQTLIFPDTLVGTDSHTTMINGLGIVGWGVGGIEAEAAMLGQPVFMQTPEVIGVCMEGKLREGVTATDLTLFITELLRKTKVVGKFVEFYGEGAATLTVADRATIGNMAPEYGATMGFFPSDDKTLDYLRMTGRSENHIQQIKNYLEAQGLFGIPKRGEVDYTKVLEVDLSSIQPSVAGPKRPQDRINLKELKTSFEKLLTAPIAEGGYNKKSDERPKVVIQKDEYTNEPAPDSGGKETLGPHVETWSEVEMVTNRPFNAPEVYPGYFNSHSEDIILTHGTVVIAAITSCTNTSNPSVMIGAGLLAKKAVEKGLKIHPKVKSSLAPGSRVVTDYLEKAGLQTYLNKLGFNLVAYGCTTCIGNSGPLEEFIEKAIKDNDLVAASVLSGNRNFEARIHSAVKANFLMSPPLVVAFALAGRVDIDMEKEPLGHDKTGNPVYLREIWPSAHEIQEAIDKAIQPEMFKERYARIQEDNPIWKEIKTSKGARYAWDEKSTYIQKPPYFDNFKLQLPERVELKNLTVLALFGDSVTTDHISPAGAFRADSPAGKYLLSKGVKEIDFNSYGSRRGNHHVMKRGTFANVRLRNKMAEGKEGGFTKLLPEGTIIPIFDACQIYEDRKMPLIIFAGKDYGMGSSRDWAAKGTALLGVRVVVAQSFERIHRSNLIGMGVLPLQFQEGEGIDTFQIDGTEKFNIIGLEETLKPMQEVTLEIIRGEQIKRAKVMARMDTPIEVEYYLHGGILPYTLRQILNQT